LASGLSASFIIYLILCIFEWQDARWVNWLCLMAFIFVSQLASALARTKRKSD